MRDPLSLLSLSRQERPRPTCGSVVYIAVMAFVTHCGQNSLNEAFMQSKPGTCSVCLLNPTNRPGLSSVCGPRRLPRRSPRPLPQSPLINDPPGGGGGGRRTVVGLPVFADQLVLCARVADTGAGLCLTPLTSAWTAAQLSDAVLTILNDPLPFAAAADRHRRLMRAAGGATRAADVVELAAAVPQARASPSLGEGQG